MNHLIVLLLLSFGAYTATATTVHVCTDADGKKSFQDKPCDEGLKADTKTIETNTSSMSSYDPSAKTAAYQQMRSDNERRQLDRNIKRSENKIVDYRNNMQRELSLLRK